jgi:alanyl-tRNA synthetase
MSLLLKEQNRHQIIARFKELGYVRKLCPRCHVYYWTQHADQETCGEANSDGCASYTFIGNSPTKKSFDLHQMREAFLSYFENTDTLASNRTLS